MRRFEIYNRARGVGQHGDEIERVRGAQVGLVCADWVGRAVRPQGAAELAPVQRAGVVGDGHVDPAEGVWLRLAFRGAGREVLADGLGGGAAVGAVEHVEGEAEAALGRERGVGVVEGDPGGPEGAEREGRVGGGAEQVAAVDERHRNKVGHAAGLPAHGGGQVLLRVEALDANGLDENGQMHLQHVNTAFSALGKGRSIGFVVGVIRTICIGVIIMMIEVTESPIIQLNR